ncbi:D-alanyl-D-alanine carboxypeptidase [hydrothermal vent metagenome]|uniref:D-alanyl-D-alanine carboxypeptidase n=1 Tax=hydrothermal vent metagenome TaxID=652676 RepID=A0A3B0TZ43_9ZZZZ
MSQRAVFGLRINVLRAFSAAFLTVLVVLGSLTAGANAQSKRTYAGFVLDAKTGATLYSYAADSARYPASVTKVMTLYILFQELKAGRMTLGTRLNVSRYAAAAVPTKLNLRAGSTIKVGDAIKALVTLSANDVARAIAENISGSESKFAQRMTSTARALGMTRTTYVNASGLPNSRQITTVRDQARLGAAIFQHFPQYYKYFQTRSFTYKGRTYGNHNRLLGRNGIDGIKTGYINASGYNLLTAARINNRHIIVVGFGFNSGSARNAKVAELVARYLPRARRGTYWAQAIIPRVGAFGARNVYAVAQNAPVTPMPRPATRLPAPVAIARETVPQIIQVANRQATSANNDNANNDNKGQTVALVRPEPPLARPGQTRPLIVAKLEAPTELIPNSAIEATNRIAPPTPRPRTTDVLGAWLSKNFQLGPRAGDPVYPARTASLIPPASIGGSSQVAIDLMTSGAIAPGATLQNAASVNGSPPSSWVVQIGAPPSAQAAERMLNDATRRISGLNNFRPYVEQFEKTGRVFYRARFAGFAKREQAVSVCQQIKQQNISCLAVQS